MCGIAGIYTKGYINPIEIKDMARALRHRGPEYRGYYFSQKVALAHTRLSIIDIEGGNQPLYDREKKIILVANGEIYNFVELAKDLKKKGHYFLTNSDCETIIHAYLHAEENFLEEIYGMFAFALYDSRKKRLILGRDRLGIKPLFYLHQKGKYFIFASEIKAILMNPNLSLTINEKALSEFFCNQFSTGRDTIFSQIKKVMPGEMVVIDENLELSSRKYWSLTSVNQRELSFHEAKEEFDSLFPTVLKQHLRSDVPYGIFLSGGVDSATILAMVKKYQPHPISSFSIGYRQVLMKDESQEAAYIATLFNTNHYPIFTDPDQLQKRMVYSFWCIDDLMRDYASVPTSILSEKASRELKVVLTGEGGDEIFAGYGRYRGRFKRLIKSFLYPGGGFRQHSTIPLRFLKKIFTPQLARYIQFHQSPFIEKWEEANPSWSTLTKYQYIDITTALPDNLLVKVDRITMGFSLEARVPFLDHRIVEFGISLPDELKTRGREGKYFLKEWASHYIPRGHLYRKKTGFGVPVGEIFSKEVIKEVHRQLKKNKGIREWFLPKGIDYVFTIRDKKNQARIIWSLVQFAIWHNMFIEKKGKTPHFQENILEWIA